MRGCHAVVAVTKIALVHLQAQRWWPTKARAGPVSDDWFANLKPPYWFRIVDYLPQAREK